VSGASIAGAVSSEDADASRHDILEHMPRLSPLIALTGATFAVGLGELVVAGILPPLASDVHVTIPVAGQLIGGYALLFAVLTPFLAATFGGSRRKTGLLLGLGIVALANALAVVAPTYICLLATRLLAAAGSALVSPLALSLIGDVVPPERQGRAQGIVFAGFSVAMTVGLPVGVLVAEHFGWRAVFVLIAIASALAAVPSAMLRVPASAQPPLQLRSMRSALTPAVERLLSISFFCLVAQYVVFPYLRPYLADVGHYDLNTSAFLLFLMGAFGSVGNVGGGFVLERFGARNAIVISLGANVVIFVLMRAFSGPLAISAVLFIAWGIASWAFSPSVNHALAEAGGDHRDVALALNMTAFNLGITVGSGLGGAIIAISGVADTLVAGAVLLVIGVIIALWLPRQSPPPAARYS
jgi:predicted MFS family arabinose efflux permease